MFVIAGVYCTEVLFNTCAVVNFGQPHLRTFFTNAICYIGSTGFILILFEMIKR